MRRNSKVNPKLSKIVARTKLPLIVKSINGVKWSWEKRSRIKYKELVKYQDQYNIKVYG